MFLSTEYTTLGGVSCYRLKKLNKRYAILKLCEAVRLLLTMTTKKLEPFMQTYRLSNIRLTMSYNKSEDFNARIGLKLDENKASLGNYGCERRQLRINVLSEQSLCINEKPYRQWTWPSQHIIANVIEQNWYCIRS